MFSDFIQQHFSEHDTFYEHLMSLFQRNDKLEGERYYTLKEVEEINQLMKKKILSLDRFRRSTERLLQNWYINIFSQPVLVSCGYTKSYHCYNNSNNEDDNSPLSFDKESEYLLYYVLFIL